MMTGSKPKVFLCAVSADFGDDRYWGALPELRVLQAEIDPTPENLDAAAAVIRGDASLPQDEEHGFGDGEWGLLPRIEAIAPDHPPLPELRAARDRYNAARDAWLERTGGIPEPDPVLSDAEVARFSAEPQLQDTIREALRQNDLPGEPADQPIEVKRGVIEALIRAGVINIGAGPDANG